MTIWNIISGLLYHHVNVDGGSGAYVIRSGRWRISVSDVRCGALYNMEARVRRCAGHGLAIGAFCVDAWKVPLFVHSAPADLSAARSA